MKRASHVYLNLEKILILLSTATGVIRKENKGFALMEFLGISLVFRSHPRDFNCEKN